MCLGFVFLLFYIFLNTLFVECPDNYLYKFPDTYDGSQPEFCVNGVCGIATFIGEKIQTFPFSQRRFYDPDYMPCGLEFKISKIVQIDSSGNEIHPYMANMENPQRLFYVQPNVYNYTYCNPQVEISSTSTTAFPFDKTVTNTLQAFYYPQLNCTPVNAFLSSSQVYLTNATLLDNNFASLIVDFSVFTTSGNMVNMARNQSQFVEPGNVFVNFTISRVEWSGDVACTQNNKVAESLLIVFYIAGAEKASLIEGPNSGYGCNAWWDFTSGTSIMSGIGIKDGKIISALPSFIGTSPSKQKSYFSIRVTRFKDYFSYGGVYLMQNKNAICYSSGGSIGIGVGRPARTPCI